MADSEKPANPGTPYSTGTSSTPSTTRAGEGAGSHKENVKENTRQTARDMKSTAQQQVTGLLDQQKGIVADHTGRLAAVFRNMAEQFDEQDQHSFSRYATNLARSTDSLSVRLRDGDIDTLLSQAQEYSRRQPAVFIGGAIATGFLLARFLRSSGERSHSEHGHAQQGYPRHSETQHTGHSNPIL